MTEQHPLHGLPADAVGIARGGEGAAVLHDGRVLGVWEGRRWEAELGGTGRFVRHGVVYGPNGHVLVESAGRFGFLDGRTGEVLAGFKRSTPTHVVRRGVLDAERVVLEVGSGFEVYEPRTERVVLRMQADVAFMGAVNTCAIDPLGRTLEVAGSEGMDAGWFERFELSTGASLGKRGAGYGIDAVDLDPDGGSVFLDDYRGLAGFPHTGSCQGRDLWLCGDALYVTFRERVLRLTDPSGPEVSWAASWPSDLCASDDGSWVAVITRGHAHITPFPGSAWAPS
ncbi:MAG: hypothetical protein R3F61_25990 [Myxococcota bacterium]